MSQIDLERTNICQIKLDFKIFNYFESESFKFINFTNWIICFNSSHFKYEHINHFLVIKL